MLTYSKADYAKEWQVGIGYVLPELRQQGVYSRLWKELVALAKRSDKPPKCITSNTSLSNKAMRATAKKQKREETGVILRFDV